MCFLAISYLQFLFSAHPSLCRLFRVFQPFSQLCKIKGEQSQKKKKKDGKVAYCVLYLSTQSTSDSRTVCSVKRDELHLYAPFLSHQIPAWRDSSTMWGLIKPVLEGMNFDWIHYSGLFYHWMSVWACEFSLVPRFSVDPSETKKKPPAV